MNIYFTFPNGLKNWSFHSQTHSPSWFPFPFITTWLFNWDWPNSRIFYYIESLLEFINFERFFQWIFFNRYIKNLANTSFRTRKGSFLQISKFLLSPISKEIRLSAVLLLTMQQDHSFLNILFLFIF